MSWYKVEISVDAVVNHHKHSAFQDQFDALWMAAGAPKEASLFSAKGSGFPVKYFIPPKAYQFAKGLISAYKGEPCDPPGKDDVAVCCGHVSDNDMLCT